MQTSDESSLPVYYGPPLRRPFVSVLNSRQGKTPVGKDPWVKKTIDAVRALNEKGVTILSSTGMQTWGLLTWAVGHYGGRQIVVHPLFRDEDPEKWIEEIIDEYNLAPEKTGFAFYKTDCPLSRPKKAWPERDRTVVHLSDDIYPISVRRGGNLYEMIRKFKTKWARVKDDFAVDYHPRKIDKLCLPSKDELKRKFCDREWNYITHWTHTFAGPWPGENRADFYKAISISGDDYPRSSFESICRILRCGKIFGTTENFRNNIPSVSFTALSPFESIDLMRWNPRKGRYSMEPYGIAIDSEVASEYGVRPVVYGDEEIYSNLDDEGKLYFQADGKKANWRMEHEWRLAGDFDISALPKGSFFAIVPTEREALILAANSGCKAISLE